LHNRNIGQDEAEDDFEDTFRYDLAGGIGQAQVLIQY
jgi:hypothetical protein